MEGENYWERNRRRGLSRRRILQGMGFAGAAAVFGTVVACGGDDDNSGSNGTNGPGSNPSANASPAAVKRGGQLIVRRPSAMTFADPHRSSSGYDPTANHLYAAPLLSLNAGKLGPSLVEKWEQVDQTTITLTLRQGLTFTDGTPVNAEAIKYSFERQADPAIGAPRRAILSGLTVQTTDERTATLKFQKPNSTFLESLGMNAPGGVAALISPTAHKQLGDDRFNEAPVSVGPFKIQKLSLDGESVFVANEAWPLTAPNGDKLPYLDKVVIKVIPQTAVAVAELQSGGIDVDYVFLGENVKQIESRNDLAVNLNKGAITQRIGLHLSKAPTDIVAFRKALAHAFNRDEFAAVFTDGFGGPGRGPLTELSWAYDPSLPTYAYDEKKAKDYLSQAGLAHGTSININTYTSGVYPRIGEMIQSQLRKLNIDLKVDNLEVPVIVEKYRKNGEYATGLEGGGAPQGDPYQYLQTNFGTANQPGGTKMTQVDALLEKALSVFDNEARKQVYREIIQLDYDNVYKIWLIEPPTIAGHRKNVQGLQWLPSGSAIDVAAAWLS